MNYKEIMGDYPNFPSEGVTFRDISYILENPLFFGSMLGDMIELCPEHIDKIVAIDSRGFLIGAPLALRLCRGLVLARKPGKLPGEVLSESYSLEYGESSLEIKSDLINKGDRVVIVDDVLATGGTLGAAASLVEKLGGEVICLLSIIELEKLEGRAKLPGYNVQSLIRY